MLSAFSFGKIIKTFLPGIILLMALFLFADVAYQMLFINVKTGLITLLIKHANFTTVLGITVPLGILFGIFLNTVLWATVIENLREKWRGKEDQCVRDSLEHLKNLANKNVNKIIGEKEAISLKELPITLRYYYLPVIKLENLNYIWENYFSWFEFQINILFALLLLLLGIIATAIFYISKYHLIASINILSLVIISFLTIVTFGVVAFFLLKSAQKNIWRFDESLVCLIAGSLSLPQSK